MRYAPGRRLLMAGLGLLAPVAVSAAWAAGCGDRDGVGRQMDYKGDRIDDRPVRRGDRSDRRWNRWHGH